MPAPPIRPDVVQEVHYDICPPCGARFSVQRRTSVRRGRLPAEAGSVTLKRAPQGFYTLTTGHGDCRMIAYALVRSLPKTPAADPRPITSNPACRFAAISQTTFGGSPGSIASSASVPKRCCRRAKSSRTASSISRARVHLPGGRRGGHRMHHRKPRAELLLHGRGPFQSLATLRAQIYRAEDVPEQNRFRLRRLFQMHARPHRTIRVVQHLGGDGSQNELPEWPIPVGRHHDQANIL